MWTKIVKTNFPGRTGLAAKNRSVSLLKLEHSRIPTFLRYNGITRFHSRPGTRITSKTAVYYCKSPSTSSLSSVSPAISMRSTPDPSSPCSLQAPDILSQFSNSAGPAFVPILDLPSFLPPGYDDSPLSVENSVSMEGVTATSISEISDDIFTNNYALLSPLSTLRSSQLIPYSADLQLNYYEQQALRTSIPPLSSCTATSLASLTLINDKCDALHVSHDHISWDRYKRGPSPTASPCGLHF